MATFSKYGSGWRAQVARRGVRRSKVFPSKGAAVAWAGQVEAEIMAGVRGEIPNLTVKALFERYEKQVSKGKKGERWEVIRLGLLGRDRISKVRLRALDTPDVAEWQERRLEAVSGASVRRERNLLNNVFNIAVKEWKWLRKNPFEGVRRPKDGKPRNRLASPEEIKALTETQDDLTRAVVAALETGMRAGEIPRAQVSGKVAYLADTKNGEVREVPLSGKAIEAFEKGINLTAGSISTLFARRCELLKIEGLTFHDLRHNACVSLSKKLELLELCKVMGWKDPRHATIYYSKTAADIADKL